MTDDDLKAMAGKVITEIKNLKEYGLVLDEDTVKKLNDAKKEMLTFGCTSQKYQWSEE